MFSPYRLVSAFNTQLLLGKSSRQTDRQMMRLFPGAQDKEIWRTSAILGKSSSVHPALESFFLEQDFRQAGILYSLV